MYLIFVLEENKGGGFQRILYNAHTIMKQEVLLKAIQIEDKSPVDMLHRLFGTIKGNNGKFAVLGKVFLNDKIIDTLWLCLNPRKGHNNENKYANAIFHF